MRRVLLVALAPIVFATCFFIAWVVLPPVPRCYAFPTVSCVAAFRSGGVDVFGSHQFTIAQTVTMMVGIGASMFLLAFAFAPRHPLTSLGVGVFAVALVIAVTLPAEVTGPTPSKACSTPGIDGPVSGRCVTGEAPMDDRLGARMLLVLVEPER